jgi:hypothetical protein
VAADAQRESGVGVAELVHDAARINAEGDEDRGEGVAQLVGRQAAMAKLITANNAKITRDWSEKGLGDLRGPMMPGI